MCAGMLHMKMYVYVKKKSVCAWTRMEHVCAHACMRARSRTFFFQERARAKEVRTHGVPYTPHTCNPEWTPENDTKDQGVEQALYYMYV